MEDATKRCPYCGEEILSVAKKCKHCGEWLTDNAQEPEPQPTLPAEPIREPAPEPEQRKAQANERREAAPTSAPKRKLGFIEYYFIDPFIRQYAGFKGKMSRRQFWMGYLCLAMLLFTLFCIDLVTGLIFVCTLVGALAFAVPFAAAAVRRLHDAGLSGWWFFIQFVPIVGGVWLLVLLARKGETKAQKVESLLPMDAAVAVAMVLIVGVSIIWISIRSNDYRQTKNAVYEEAYRRMAEAADAEKEANDDNSNAIPDEVVDMANACDHEKDERPLSASDFTLTANDFTLIARYNDETRHCAYYTRPDYMLTIYQYNLNNKKVRVIDLMKTKVSPKKEGRTETTPSLSEVSQIVVKGDRFYIIGSNNANGPWYEVYLISYNTIDEEFVCLDYGVDIRLINDNRQAVVTHSKLIKLGEVYADSEVKTWDETVNLP